MSSLNGLWDVGKWDESLWDWNTQSEADTLSQHRTTRRYYRFNLKRPLKHVTPETQFIEEHREELMLLVQFLQTKLNQ